MTRFLSQTLGAEEPRFGMAVQDLERASGHENTDIRLSAEIIQQTQAKIRQLGLDPQDTTGPELYGALQERLRQDEQHLRGVLGLGAGAAPSDVLSRIQQFLENHELPKSCFALKSSVAKRLLKKIPPKKAMKQLGYRSVDSMLKHEPVAHIYTAALLLETPQWLQTYREQYMRLAPGDFESRKITIMYPKAKKWEKLAQAYVGQAKQNIVCLKELGAIMILPHETDMPGLAITTFLLVFNEMNTIRAHSSFTKLQQVKPDFGEIVKNAVEQEPYTSAELAGQPVPWRLIQRFYARNRHAYHPDIFEPHVQPEDLEWYDAEDLLKQLKPALGFWEGTAALSFLYEGEPVSLNVLDVALGHCNGLGFADRIIHFVRENIWHELMMRYLNQENLEGAIQQQLSKELVGEQEEMLI
ncbi:MAG TPA: hypothetical protein VLG11_02930 [Candidatus Saccharimonadales bacterium]|nr:hypothetical protein [Candidatus Saccharimonadales bacterium]